MTGRPLNPDGLRAKILRLLLTAPMHLNDIAKQMRLGNQTTKGTKRRVRNAQPELRHDRWIRFVGGLGWMTTDAGAAALEAAERVAMADGRKAA